ncbi:hypothetical protein [Oribacterium parvum]|uniref:bacterial transcriptional activator domain-containing protein n=1 Tax=Oribacterium parvum TaxID=1501329 RepID=UPI0028E6C7E7|nr:hypothetical protein [Oribacterium parvum]
METKKKTKIYVQMLGGFSITVGDEKLDLGSNSKANFLKLTEIVLLRGMGGVSKRDLIDGIFGHKSLLDENNSLNNLLHQARTQLKKAGMPGRKIIDGKRGVYAPENNPDYEYILDVQEFEDVCLKAKSEKKDDKKLYYYQKAFGIYGGELLPEFATDYWVILESVRLKRLYDDVVDFLGKHYKEAEDFEALFDLYDKANKIYPDNGWQIEMIDALILRKEYKTAYELYTKCAHYYQDELEVPIPDALRSCYERLSDNVRVVTDDIRQIQANIIRKDEKLKSEMGTRKIGAYLCPFTSFIDVYHVLRRNLERRGSSIFMMLGTLVDYEGKPIQNQEKLNARAEILQQSLSEGLRKGDVYTKYSSSQYLILLIGTKREDCAIIYQRLSRRVKELAGSRAEFRYRIVSLAEIPGILDRSQQGEDEE